MPTHAKGVEAKNLRQRPLKLGGGGAGITAPNGGGNIGREEFGYDEDTAHKVKMLRALGNSQEAIAFACDMCVETLLKYYKRELDLGSLETKWHLGAAIVTTALGEEAECPECDGTGKREGSEKRCKECKGKGRLWVREPNPTSQIWASKNLMGWSDQQRIEHTGADGGPIVMEQRSAAPTIQSRLQAIRERQAALPKPDAE